MIKECLSRCAFVRRFYEVPRVWCVLLGSRLERDRERGLGLKHFVTYGVVGMLRRALNV
mgnify:CR=1 FL=1